jgi:hypothetical protein
MNRIGLIPNRPALQHLMPLVKGIWNPAEKKPASGTAVRQWLANGTVVINGEKVDANEMLDFPIWSIVVFPNSDQRRVTIW